MARQKFALNTEPHVAEIGDDIELLFKPEVTGEEFLAAHERLQQAQAQLTDGDGQDRSVAEQARVANLAVKLFLAGFMLPKSALVFARWEVRDPTGQVVLSTGDPGEAERHAAKVDGAQVADVGMALPDRVLLALTNWVTEVYGGGRPTGLSGGSATASPPSGRRSTGSSRSRVSTPARGR
ncbi:hypothetical protein F5972_08080 [Microbispora cellulosiformans]|uniref:Uncharacterized protein n=1 Tax=Microbispora cellulosiformans TaxID=2614688 RepID=A0A5J5K7D6_9ACTN|nr:hypothetical protein [Microbispora cellulosiformans]KAA9379604.1 hypothetical protein F5972_08080 [Microbispora cellulosiformans]